MNIGTIGKFELIDHGIEHSQYFQGCGVAFTRFAYVITGIGDNLGAAIDDCLEGIAHSGFETEDIEAQIHAWYISRMARDMAPSVPCDEELDCEEPSEVHYHVSIRWNEGAAQ